LRYRQMRPDVARDALLATHGGRSLSCARSSALSRPWPSTVWPVRSTKIWSPC
jgi:hypothetical protein